MRQVYQRVFGFSLGGIPLLPTLVGSFLLMSTMFLWYGSFFKDAFYFGMGITEDDVTAEALQLWYPIGLVLSMSQGIGLAIVLKWRNWPSMLQTVQTALVTSIFFASLTFSYRLVVLPDHNHELFYVNASGIITAFTLCAVAITALRPRNVEVNDREVSGLLHSEA
ncbi:MAG: hypothetical protein ACFB11_09990 [Paracoccaceae bacterium]